MKLMKVFAAVLAAIVLIFKSVGIDVYADEVPDLPDPGNGMVMIMEAAQNDVVNNSDSPIIVSRYEYEVLDRLDRIFVCQIILSFTVLLGIFISVRHRK